MNFEKMKEDLEARGAEEHGLICIPKIGDKFVIIEYTEDGLPRTIEQPVSVLSVYEKINGGGIRPIFDIGKFKPEPPKSEDEKQQRIEELEVELESNREKYRLRFAAACAFCAAQVGLVLILAGFAL